MDTKSLLRWSLLLIVFGSLGFYMWQKSQRPLSAAPADAAASAAGEVAAAAVVVTYFTTDVRCTSCRVIEDLSRRAIETDFAAEIADGRVAYRVINTDEAEHAHYREHYELTNKTVIVSRLVDGVEVEWVNQHDVWALLEQPEQFSEYVTAPVRAYLAKRGT